VNAAVITSAIDARLPGRFVCLDLETTGADPEFNRIIEVGIVLIDDGEITERWSSLVDPGGSIPERIQAFTGITDAMVASAPSCVQLIDEIRERCKDRVFAAHNARFDYGFLRAEFARAGRVFDVPVLCTVKLSRRLDSDHATHNLDAVIERYGLKCETRHRALPDAQGVADFMLAAAARFGAARLQHEIDRLLRPLVLPPQLPASLPNDLPTAHGVYRFFDAAGEVLFVGRATSLRGSVLSHFGESRKHASAELRERVYRVEWLRTTGEWSAHLLELAWRNQRQPSLQYRKNQNDRRFTLQLTDRASGPVVRPLSAEALEHCYGEFRSEAAARRQLQLRAREHQLCLRVLGLEEGEGSCLLHQLGRCRGACIGKESLALHDIRVQMAFAGQRFQAWPFEGRVAFTDARHDDGAAAHVFDRWCYLGSARDDSELAELAHARTALQFDLRIYRLTTEAFQQGRVRARPLPL
jgi:DNA polymerase III subunit epsilon